ncbi:MAG: Tn3 family transposase, partial [Flavobacterium sp.]|nr:Tn3 family transposase [Flavobacterium sp.]
FDKATLELSPNNFWRILPHEKHLFQKKHDVSKLLYLLFFRWFEIHVKFPKNIETIPSELLEYGFSLSKEVIDRKELLELFKQERTVNRYKQEIREHFKFKVFSEDNQIFQSFLMENVFKEKNEESLCVLLQNYLKKTKIAIPDDAVLVRAIQQAKIKKEQQVFSQIYSAISPKDINYIDNYLFASSDLENPIQLLRQDSGASTKEAVKQEIKRLQILNQLPITSLKFINDINAKQISIYKRRFLTDTPGRSQRRSEIDRYTLTAIFCYQRHQAAIDNLIEHLVHFIHQIKKAEHAKQLKLNNEIGKRLGDIEQLYQVAEINRDHPKEIIEEVVYPTVSQDTIDQIIKTKNFARRGKKIIQEAIVKRYANSYRSIIFQILSNLEINSNNLPLSDALKLIQTYRDSKQKYYPIEEIIPLNNLISKQEQKKILEYDEDNNHRILRKDYECTVLKLLRTKLRHKEAWVNGAYKYRDPKDDLPKDFDEKRNEYFDLIGAPLASIAFVSKLKEEMYQHIKKFDQDLPKNEFVRITKKKGKTWILLTPLQKIEEPKVIQNIKEAILSKWSIIDLLDILKEVDLRENFTDCFSTAGNREVLGRDSIRKRLLFCLFAFGTNAGLKRTAGASRGAVTFEELRHVRKFFINKEDLREAIDTVVNSIFRIRNPKIWKSVSTACAADSKQFGCYTKNLLTEWSPRHHNKGVMIYWHVNDQYICVYSQLKTCTSSEVASMLQGIINQETDMDIKSQYVDSHGKSELGFALSYLENFDLLPRYKTIGNQKIYLPSDDFQVEHIGEIVTRSINWQLVEEQYNEMIKHAVALKIGTSTAETVIRKFARTNYQHPTFKAFIELGKAVKTIFLCRYLNFLELRQQINAGLNVVENWNSANDFVFYGKGSEITSNYLDDQEISMLCLHLLQNSIMYINTLLVEELLQDPYWINQLSKEDYRALTALFYLHINPYGIFELDLLKRLRIHEIGATT